MNAADAPLAEVEVYHSRVSAPTRRLALGHLHLPVEPAPGLGGVLLGGIVATHLGELDEDIVPDIHRLLTQVERNERVVQPRLRHRYQVDRHGLSRSVHRLVADSGSMRYDFDVKGSALQQVLGALYCLERLDVPTRQALAPVVRRAMRWRGPFDAQFLAYLAGSAATSLSALGDPRAWALEILGFPPGTVSPSRREVQRRYRDGLRNVHPDHGGKASEASGAIERLGDARRVLLET